MPRCRDIVAVLIAAAVVASVGFGSPATAHAETGGSGGRAERLAAERLRQRGERIDEGLALVLFGSASVLGGGMIAAIGHSDERWLWAGVGTSIWGAVNIALGIPMLDPAGRDLCDIERDRLLRGEALAIRREELARGQYGAAALFAFNLGLDVFYIAGGVLLAILGHELPTPVPGLTGYGVAMAIQGLGLGIYDLAGWIRAKSRGDRLLDLEREQRPTDAVFGERTAVGTGS